ncbi:MAG TPA: oxygenase MpaB family protein [Anditalea sp.]|nr:oxygenase MpaB family protein [Anditalea sp.]
MSKLNLYTDQAFEVLRYKVDPLADDAVKVLVNQPDLASIINSWTHIPDDLPAIFPEELVLFWKFYNSVPNQIDDEKVRKSHDFFSKNGNTYLGLLGFYALPYCYAFADGAQVLVRSKRILEDQGKRLIETAGFVLESFRPGSFLGNRSSLLVIAKVRLIHAFARYFIDLHDHTWEDTWGRPVNQEDMLGTNGAFSYLVIRGFRKIGQPLDQPTVEALLHYWKIIGYYMGINIDYWPETAKEAIYLEKLIRVRQMKKSSAGEKLINSLMNYYKESTPSPLSNFVETVIAYFIGEKASESLAISQKYSLPPTVFAQILKFNFKAQSTKAPSYSHLSAEFKKVVRQDYEGRATINLPVIPLRGEKTVHNRT